MSHTPVSFTCLAIIKEKNNANHVSTVNLLSVTYIWKHKGGWIYDFTSINYQGGDDTVFAFVLGKRLYRLYLHVKGSGCRYIWEFVILNLDVTSGFNPMECFFSPPVVIGGIAQRQTLNSFDSPTFLSWKENQICISSQCKIKGQRLKSNISHEDALLESYENAEVRVRWTQIVVIVIVSF